MTDILDDIELNSGSQSMHCFRLRLLGLATRHNCQSINHENLLGTKTGYVNTEIKVSKPLHIKIQQHAEVYQ